jgi:hypothetical protein
MKRHWGTDELVEHGTLLPRESELLTNPTLELTRVRSIFVFSGATAVYVSLFHTFFG